MNPLEMVSKIFGLAIDVREFLYNKNVLRSFDVGVPVLSIGNLTFGGTGKTPTCDFLITQLKNKKKIAVLSRGYGRKTKGFFKVDPQELGAAQKFGDEPTWLAQRHPDVSVYVCEDRVSGVKRLLKEKKVDLILADDAFQHLRLKRTWDLIVLDATEALENYNYPPFGRARNSWKYLGKSHFAFITKTNLADAKTLRELKQKTSSIPTFEFGLNIKDFKNIRTQKILDKTPREVYLLSGIGKPWTFESLVKKDFSFGIKKHFQFSDHFSYTQENFKKIEKEVGDKPLLVTQKDAVKLKNIKSNLEIYESELSMVPLTNMDKFYELLT